MQLLNLIQGAEVEWKNITEVFKLRNGYTPSKKNLDFWDENLATIPWFRMEDIRTNGHILSDSIQHITEKAVKGNLFKANSIIIATSATIGEHALITVDFMCNQRFTCFTISDEYEDKLLPKFAYYYFFSIDKFVQQTQKQSSMPAADMEALKNLEIPIPSPEIQQKVVEILDKMTDYVTELTAELTLRQKQYAYYRDQLLTFGVEGNSLSVRWTTLGELCQIGDGLHGTPIYDKTGDYYFINGNNLKGGNISYSPDTKKVNNKSFDKYGIGFSREKTVFLSINGTVGSVALYKDEKIVLGKSVAYFNILNEQLSLKYLFHLLQTKNSKDYYEKSKTGSTIKNLGLKALRDFKIPLPNLTEQKRIVKILDKFDSLTSDLTEGLPREIALRQKQYEYWRKELLNFSKK
ncbi:restriction endonuclease subunit S [Lactococcus garvieae]|uniref:restriction endonuclease subunit S n=1 Tax=Lactococcus garvieae TaxID=1363 RepID=UPI0038534DB4